MKALSIRQPWAWLIANGYKDIENRSWRTNYRGPVLIHASAAMPTWSDWVAALEIHQKFSPPDSPYPDRERFNRGGIVGVATITDCVDKSPSPWFFGPKGFTLTDAKPLPFYPMKGKLSFFETGLTPEDLKGGAA
ncbi:ASCH domain-containing protein [Cronobacter sakazakii]|uniref:ASCH domain-containing protein n=1 Tax=Cronobacter sakazakii TaxID=28141 RepID=UPI000A11BAA0|nr:ASCH domain-containing protein [Cronobacter sakazakii]ELY4583062.1 ASCH domain-containing protein [Cronobacter malonaticus]EGZ6857670.1 ASCH domain-containing protein [Cronobacter sakazakii]EGZ6870468.1 ASCH domain-containing protein [Cronobacter sakazakii]EJE1165880.1 ASCH domain-containing protein [Cronobacter sakazakii]EKA0999348.1 ASCH domain-containing protein [Cronobacter sakazakii]